jgi:chemotaxis response regulator CheB
MDKGRGRRKKTQVLVFSDQTLLADGIEDVLRCEESVEILGWETDPDRARRSISQIHPDVVILAGANAADAFAPAVMAVLKGDLAVKVVEVTLESSHLYIYGKEVRVVQEVQGLLEAIEQSAAGKNDAVVGTSSDPGSVAKFG